MNDEELEQIGIIADKSKLRPNRYWCNIIQDNINISKGTKLEVIMEKIFQNGYAQGIDTGKTQRSQEFKNLLNDD